MPAFPVLPVRVCTSATRGRVLDFPSLVRLSARHVLRHKRLEREPSTASPKGSDAATGEGWLQGHERGCCGLLTGSRTPDATARLHTAKDAQETVPT